MNFDVARMGKHESAYDKAVKAQARHKAALGLVCQECHYQNRPGSMGIDVDEFDDARCDHCGYIWQVRVE